MVDIVCAFIAAVATVLCAIVAAGTKKRDKQMQEAAERAEARSAQRTKEGRLQLAMISADTKLTVGVAMALKHGHCNGEVEEGLEAVRAAQEEYTRYLSEIAMDSLRK